MKSKRFLSMILAIACVAVFAFPVFAADYTLKVGSIVSESHPDYICMRDVFKPLVEANSDGKIEVEIYPNAQLGGDREMAEAVQLGTLEMCIPATAALAGFDPRIQIIDLPYLFEDRAEAYAALDGELGKAISDNLPEQGFVNLGYPENGFRHVTNNSRPIYEPADLEGLKIRTMEIPAHIDYFKALGANPTPMSWGELYTALQQGTVDGQENPIAMIYDGKFYEVQDYCSLTGHFYSSTVLLTSKAFMDGLPEDLREVVERAARMFVLAQREMIADLEEERIEELKAAGMEINSLTDEQKEKFAEAANAIYDKYEDTVGKDVMEIAQEIRN